MYYQKTNNFQNMHITGFGFQQVFIRPIKLVFWSFPNASYQIWPFNYDLVVFVIGNEKRKNKKHFFACSKKISRNFIAIEFRDQYLLLTKIK